ncbi:MAG: 2-C-methyl-D-erythritol 4-phosphate cytidylyltransferase, partial [Bacilli bacterium]|nr:2-C-methyl-D-erythritol 4-phosphate cytidylyltransferase [Bacilli bacterium]
TIFKIHKDAYGNRDLSSTDDIQLASRARKEIFLVRGSKRNIKVTTPEDLQILGALLTTPKF